MSSPEALKIAAAVSADARISAAVNRYGARASRMAVVYVFLFCSMGLVISMIASSWVLEALSPAPHVLIPVMGWLAAIVIINIALFRAFDRISQRYDLRNMRILARSLSEQGARDALKEVTGMNPAEFAVFAHQEELLKVMRKHEAEQNEATRKAAIKGIMVARVETGI